MEAHPVPKNVLNVEFKLFGALSVKQFSKVLVGCAVALVLYLLPIPGLVAIPLMIIAVLTGVGAALIPAFEVRLAAIIKSIFVSPRYVWRKSTKVPDVLTAKAKQKAQKAEEAQKEKPQRQQQSSIDDMTIDQILAARSAYTEQAGLNTQDTGGNNFTRVYEEQFGDEASAEVAAPRTGARPPAGAPQSSTLAGSTGTTTSIQPLINSTRRTNLNSAAIAQAEQEMLNQNKANLSEDQLQKFRNEINDLRNRLNKLNKEEGNDQERKQILDRISEIYDQVGVSEQPQPQLPTAGGVIAGAATQNLFGVVVDKKEKPIPGAHLSVTNETGQPLGYEAISSEDGRLALTVPDGLDEFFVTVQKEGYKFYPFKVKIVEGRIPAYKFKEHS